jgi:hypothetical protein
MRYTGEMGSGVMIYIPSFIKIGSDIQPFMGRWGWVVVKNTNSGLL